MSRKPQPSYFVVMIAYPGLGREAVVDPKLARADILARIKSGEYQRIEFIHHISDGFVDVVTDELLNEAEGELKAEAMDRADRVANTMDHAHKLRAEAV